MRRFRNALVPIIYTLVILLGCTGEELNSPLNTDTPVVDSPDPLGRAFFTGRDSFGVAFQATVKDAEFQTDTANNIVTMSVTGNGNATHLGRVQIHQQHEIDLTKPQKIMNGEFLFSGKNDQYVTGSYKGEIHDTDLSGVFQIRDHTVSATKAEEDTGWAEMSGSLNQEDGQLTYSLDGWLLHFVKNAD